MRPTTNLLEERNDRVDGSLIHAKTNPSPQEPYNVPVLGLLITLIFSVGAAALGHLLVRKLTDSLDPALQIGLSGLVGLGAMGTLTLFIGFIPGSLSPIGAGFVGAIALVAAVPALRNASPRLSLEKPKGLEWLFVAGVAIAVLFALVSVLAPSDTVEWDSLAYHLAVPKLYIQAGQIYPITYIHHSNFPGAVDYLYIWGLVWGGEAGAKSFTLAFHLFGLLAIFGLTRQIYGKMEAWWAALAWTTVPLVLWLSGTAYIDVQNGLFAGLGILFAALWIRERTSNWAWLSGILLGLATGSKYTGLQTIFAVGVVIVIASILAKRSNPGSTATARGLVTVCGLALLIASPWYVKNTIWVGNPVYPFFYKQLGGKNWAAWNADIYQNEQQSFGAARATPDGKIEPQRIGHAILGLAYQPGRYINPGQTAGQGFLTGSVGFAVIGAMLLWLISGRAGPLESSVLGVTLLSLAMWFVLSEQSRYIIALAVPLSVLAGGGVTRLRAGPALAGAIAVQALFSLYLMKSYGFGSDQSRFDKQLQVVTGRLTRDEYMKASVGFYDPAQTLNDIVKGGRVALYDEVFGYLLDVPYFWANPGHTTELGYDSMKSGADLIAALKGHEINYVYINIIPPGSSRNDLSLQRWLSAAGIGGPPQPYTDVEKSQHRGDTNWWSKMVLADAIAQHQLEPVKEFGPRVIFRVAG